MTYKEGDKVKIKKNVYLSSGGALYARKGEIFTIDRILEGTTYPIDTNEGGKNFKLCEVELYSPSSDLAKRSKI